MNSPTWHTDFSLDRLASFASRNLSKSKTSSKIQNNKKRYRAIERYSARRVSSSTTTSIPSSTFDSGNVPVLRQTLQVICRAASFYCSRLQSILRRRSSDFSLVGTIRLWLTNLLLVAYITLYLVPYLLLREGIYHDCFRVNTAIK